MQLWIHVSFPLIFRWPYIKGDFVLGFSRPLQNKRVAICIQALPIMINHSFGHSEGKFLLKLAVWVAVYIKKKSVKCQSSSSFHDCAVECGGINSLLIHPPPSHRKFPRYKEYCVNFIAEIIICDSSPKAMGILITFATNIQSFDVFFLF